MPEEHVIKDKTNQMVVEDYPAHNWYRFVLSYPPHLVRDYLLKFGIDDRHQVLDPFCGTGTTVVECKKLGIPSVGIEANKMAQFAAQVKVNWRPNPIALKAHAQKIADSALAELNEAGISDEPLLAKFARRNGHVKLKQLPEEAQKILLTDSISKIPLHKTLVLLDHMERNKDDRFFEHELLALAKALVTSIGNLRFGPEVGLGTIKEDAAVIEPWLECVNTMAEDIAQLQDKADIPSLVHHADSRDIVNIIPPKSVDAVITSPPYPNEKDYTRTTRLESVLLGFLKNKTDLRALKQGLIRSNTRNVYKVDDDDLWVMDQPEIQRIAVEIEARRKELGKTSGFERLYGRVTKLYFGGMARHLDQLRVILRPGARLAYVVGDQASYLRIMIRTGNLLADIAKSRGYEVEKIELFRTRMATATRMQLNEEVVILRWPG